MAVSRRPQRWAAFIPALRWTGDCFAALFSPGESRFARGRRLHRSRGIIVEPPLTEAQARLVLLLAKLNGATTDPSLFSQPPLDSIRVRFTAMQLQSIQQMFVLDGDAFSAMLASVMAPCPLRRRLRQMSRPSSRGR